MMKIAAAYIRVSTDDQVEYSPASQLEKIQDYAKRNGYILPTEFVFTDEGISGRTTSKRPAFNRMIGFAKTKPKPFDTILLWKFSRFARNREDSIVYKSMLRKQCGIDVISISENVGDDKMSVLIEAMIEAMDEYYSINLAEEVKRGMTEKVHRGEAVAVPSFGYEIENGIYIPNKDTAPLVKKIFANYLSGVSMRTIATGLNDCGYRTRRGNTFEMRTIRYILNNPVYIGKIRWTPTGRTRRNFENPDTLITEGIHEPIIDIATWNMVQEKLRASSKTKYLRDTSAKVPYMLQGLVRCSACGATLCMSAKHNTLQCYAYAHGKCSSSHSISIKKINKMVLNLLDETVSVRDFKLEVLPQTTDAKDYSALINKEKRKLERVKNAYENELYTLEEFKQSRKEIADKIAGYKKHLVQNSQPDEASARKKLQCKILNVLPALRSPAIPETDKNMILKSFVKRIVFYRSSCSVDIFFYV